jgi:hypothetical protein
VVQPAAISDARCRIAELERQIRKARNPSSPPLLDEATVERAIRVAVERERAVCGRN